MFGILIEFLMLPLKVLKLFFELIELLLHIFGGGHGHRKQRHKPRASSRQKTTTVSVSRSNDDMFQERIKLLEESLKIARQEHLQYDTRLKAYETALEICNSAEPYVPHDKQAKAKWKKLKNTIVSEQTQVMSAAHNVPTTETTNIPR